MAHSALIDMTSSNQPFEIDKILPADTWCQPVEPVDAEAIDESEAMKQLQDELSSLNINKESNIDTSDLLRRILSFKSDAWQQTMQSKIEQLAKQYTITIFDPREGPNPTLANVRTCLRTIGSYVVDLRVQFKDGKYPKQIDRFYQKLSQYIGPNLKSLRLVYMPNNDEWLHQLKPLLSRIESLHVSMSNYDFDFDIDFQLFCPKLKTLKINMNLRGELLTKAWLSLERWSNRNNQYMEERLVLDFMRNNPQLKYLNVAANDSENLLQQIPEHLINLEHLVLYEAYPGLNAGNLIHLAEIKQLRKLKLMYLEEEEFDGIVACLPKFKQLHELKLHLFYDGPDTVDIEDVFQPNESAIVTLSQELQDLESFHLRYCAITAQTMYDFIRNAKHLKCFGIFRCGLCVTDEILENIEAIRKTPLTLYADNISVDINKEVRITIEHFQSHLLHSTTFRYLFLFQKSYRFVKLVEKSSIQC